VAEVDRDRLVGDLASLVRIPSITGAEDRVAAWAADALRSAGLTVEVLEPDPASVRADPEWPGQEVPRETLPVVIGRAGVPGGRRVLLSGHVDVVPPGDPATWSVDPWGAEVRGGRLYGRGACDMKGGVAAIIAAVRALHAGGHLARLDGELLVALVPSEPAPRPTSPSSPSRPTSTSSSRTRARSRSGSPSPAGRPMPPSGGRACPRSTSCSSSSGPSRRTRPAATGPRPIHS
jgi:hypothetical protein